MPAQAPQYPTFASLQQQQVGRPPAPKPPQPTGQVPPNGGNSFDQHGGWNMQQTDVGSHNPKLDPSSIQMHPSGAPVGPGGSPYQGGQATPGGGAPTGYGGSPYHQGQGTPGGGAPVGWGGSPYNPPGGQEHPTPAPAPRPPAPAPQPQAPQGPGGYQGGVPPWSPQGGGQGGGGGSYQPPAYPTGGAGLPPVQSMWEKLAQGGGSNFQPGGYQGPGQLNAYQRSTFQGPQAQQQGHFDPSQSGAQVDQRTQQSVLQALGNPSRYGAQQVGDAYDVLNRRLTQGGNADLQRINEDMASRGIYASTTAGGRMGDLATNLNQQRADYATQLSTDQARNYQSDRASAISQAMGFGGQQFGQGLQGFEANQGAGQQRYNQEMGAGQFGLQQNQQNFSQQAQQYGANQQEGLNNFNSGLDRAQFGLNQNNQNFNQRLQGTQGLQNFGQQSFNNQLQGAQFNSDQDYRNNDLLLRSLGML